MRSIDVPLKDRSYPVLVGQGLLGDFELWDRILPDARLLVLTNDVVAGLHQPLQGVREARGVGPGVLFARDDPDHRVGVARPPGGVPGAGELQGDGRVQRQRGRGAGERLLPGEQAILYGACDQRVSRAAVPGGV